MSIHISTYASDFVSSFVLLVSPSFFFLLLFLDFAFSRRLRRKPETVLSKQLWLGKRKKVKLINSAREASTWITKNYLATQQRRIHLGGSQLKNHKNISTHAASAYITVLSLRILAQSKRIFPSPEKRRKIASEKNGRVKKKKPKQTN